MGLCVGLPALPRGVCVSPPPRPTPPQGAVIRLQEVNRRLKYHGLTQVFEMWRQNPRLLCFSPAHFGCLEQLLLCAQRSEPPSVKLESSILGVFLKNVLVLDDN